MGRSSMPPEVRETVMSRNGGRCEPQVSPHCAKYASEWHHRKMRSQLGPDTIPNGLAVCPACHRYIHRHPEESYDKGYLVRSHYDEDSVPVLLPTRFFGRRWQILTPTGDYTPTAPPPERSPK